MRNWTGRAAVMAAVAAAAVIGARASWAVQISVGDGQGYPGGDTPITVSLDSEDSMVSATSNDIAYDPGTPVAEAVDAMTTLSADIGPKDVTVPVVDATGLPDFGIVVIGTEQIAYGSKTATALNVASDSMVCNPAGSTPPDCTQDSDCASGEICVPSGRGQNGTTATSHTSGSSVGLPTKVPDCKPTDALLAAGKSAVFSYLPEDCDPDSTTAPCSSIRGIVVALDNTDALPANIDLFSCVIRSQPGSVHQGVKSLPCSNEQSSTPPPPVELDTTCNDGAVGLCTGDCDGTGSVGLSNVLNLFAAANGELGVAEACPGRLPDDSDVGLAEVLDAFENSNFDCPQ